MCCKWGLTVCMQKPQHKDESTAIGPSACVLTLAVTWLARCRHFWSISNHVSAWTQNLDSYVFESAVSKFCCYFRCWGKTSAWYWVSKNAWQLEVTLGLTQYPTTSLEYDTADGETASILRMNQWVAVWKCQLASCLIPRNIWSNKISDRGPWCVEMKCNSAPILAWDCYEMCSNSRPLFVHRQISVHG